MAYQTLTINKLQDLEEVKAKVQAETADYRHTIYVCGGAGCVSSHCTEVVQALKKAIALRGLSTEVRVVVTGCVGLCAYGPCMIVEPDGVFYGNLTPDKVKVIIDRHLIGCLLYTSSFPLFSAGENTPPCHRPMQPPAMRQKQAAAAMAAFFLLRCFLRYSSRRASSPRAISLQSFIFKASLA